jgi:hypothetical protein
MLYIMLGLLLGTVAALAFLIIKAEQEDDKKSIINTKERQDA